MSVHDRVVDAFAAALPPLRADPALSAVHAAMAGHRDRYRRKMAVALVGRVSSGKSTLVNALLGTVRTPTGVEELTYNVTWLRHGPARSVTVHFTDGRPAESRPPEDLWRLAARADGDPRLQAYLAAVAHLEVTTPDPGLVPYDLVDTPGLDALSGTARAAKTLAFLGRTPARVDDDTIAHAALADALVLVFPHAMALTDAEVVAGFVRAGLGTANPVTAVGALTKTELYWPRRDPVEQGRRDAEVLMAQPAVRPLLFALQPVAGLVAAAAGTFTGADFADLRTLSTVDRATLEGRADSGAGFVGADDLPLAPARRRALFERFGGYGVVLAADLLRREEATDEAGLRALLVERSGLADLRRLLSDHFAERADVIKLRRTIDEVGTLAERLPAGLSARERDTVRRSVALVTTLGQQPELRELAVLRSWYLGELDLDARDGAELTRVLGEHGTALPDRLGAPPGADPAGYAAQRHAYWARAAVDPRHGGVTRGACEVVLDAYDRIVDGLRRPATAAVPR